MLVNVAPLADDLFGYRLGAVEHSVSSTYVVCARLFGERTNLLYHSVRRAKNRSHDRPQGIATLQA